MTVLILNIVAATFLVAAILSLLAWGIITDKRGAPSRARPALTPTRSAISSLAAERLRPQLVGVATVATHSDEA
jgi:hypothetical protein